jgi:hypothetical protein
VYENTAGVSAHTSIPVSNKQSRTALNLENKNTESDSAQKIKSPRHFRDKPEDLHFFPPRKTDKEKIFTCT